MNIQALINILPFLGISLGFIWILNKILNARHDLFDAAEEIAKGNSAVALRRGGAQLALSIMILGVYLSPATHNLLDDVISTIIFNIVCLCFVLFSLFITDKIVLPVINNNEAVRDGNKAVGNVEFSTLVMTGLVGFASIYGEQKDFLGQTGVIGDILSSVFYFIVSQVIVVLFIFLIEMIRKGLVEKIKGGNEAASIYLGGKLISYGLIVCGIMRGDAGDISIYQQIANFALLSIISFVILFVVEFIVDKIIWTETTIQEVFDENNIAASKQLACVKIGISLVIGLGLI